MTAEQYLAYLKNYEQDIEFYMSDVPVNMRPLLNTRLRNEEDRIEYLRYGLFSFLLLEVRRGSYEAVSELFDIAHSGDRRTLVEQLGHYRNAGRKRSLYDDLTEDVIHAIVDALPENSAIGEHFIRSYSVIYSEYYDLAMEEVPGSEHYLFDRSGKASRNLESRRKEHIARVRKLLAVNAPTLESEYYLFVLLFNCRVQDVMQPMLQREAIYVHNDLMLHDWPSKEELVRRAFETHTDWAPDIYDTAQYRKYAAKNLELIYRYFGLEEPNPERLASILIMEVTKMTEACGFGCSERVVGHRIRPQWLSETEHYDKGEVFSLVKGYIRQTFSDYWFGVLIRYRMLNDGEETVIERRDVMEETPQVKPEYLTAYLYAMTEVDLISSSYADFLSFYYENFSLEQVLGKSDRNHYEHIIRRLNQDLTNQREKIVRLENENRNLRMTESDADRDESDRLAGKLSREAELLRKENEDLRAALRNYDMFERYRDEEEIEEEEAYSLPKLQEKRYLFVCYDSPILEAIKRRFPNSVFMTGESFNLNSVKVDAIVFVIRSMSHSMFNKVRSRFGNENIPTVSYNGRNAERLYACMYKELEMQQP